MLDNLQDFHFLRPWLLALVPLGILLVYWIDRSRNRQSDWKKVISPHLLQFLFVSAQTEKTRSHWWLPAALITVVILASSGPSFRQKSVPVLQTETAQVLLLDLSLSMDATDIKPSRLERAKFKVSDLLERTREGTVALVVYAGDAFVISPLTSDAKTIANMIPTLSTGIMPVLGSRPDLAMKKSIELLKNAKYGRGQIIWMTDGVEDSQIESIVQSINDSPFSLSILAIGSEQGAPIPLPDGTGFMKDRDGNIVVPKLSAESLNQIARETDAGIVTLSASDRDIEYLVERHQLAIAEDEQGEQGEQMISRWIDDGHWLVWLAMILFLARLISQKSGQLIGLLPAGLLVLVVGFPPQQAQAISWKDLWLTKNQQANRAYADGEYDKAQQLYQDPQWRATSQYRAGQFDQAAQGFDPVIDQDSLYNHATSLAKAGKLQPALDAYNQLLEEHPDHQDGQFNKKIVEDLLNQQQEQEDQDQQNQDQQDNQDQQNQDQENQDQQQDSQSEQDQQQQEQADQESQQQEQQEQQQELTEDQRDQTEKDQALEHWLEKIPDDPGGLLRRKMYREYQRRGRQQNEEKLW